MIARGLRRAPRHVEDPHAEPLAVAQQPIEGLHDTGELPVALRVEDAERHEARARRDAASAPVRGDEPGDERPVTCGVEQRVAVADEVEARAHFAAQVRVIGDARVHDRDDDALARRAQPCERRARRGEGGRDIGEALLLEALVAPDAAARDDCDIARRDGHSRVGADRVEGGGGEARDDRVGRRVGLEVGRAKLRERSGERAGVAGRRVDESDLAGAQGGVNK